ncbi:unnamed protein product [Anisakis simplex]|uniref:Beta-1,3-galactosyl-O-glycosyl-glycoprotein beta-1,6-N-acetylglucosaminyltransferase 3 n=1 Tax=Anisakis simplex TaxID=6269 RepID=A0A0M3JYD4_ANISI|nr:unnamed protein product [Anisakis simplex]
MNIRYSICTIFKLLLSLSVLCVLTLLWNVGLIQSKLNDAQFVFECDSNGCSNVNNEKIGQEEAKRSLDDDLNLSSKSAIFGYENENDSNNDYVKTISVFKAPLTLDQSADALLETSSCEAVRRRVLNNLLEPTETELQFPIAFARIVYKDYILQELLFKMQYAPQNRFCYILDKKARPLFKQQMRNLANCFPNVVILADRQWTVDSAGHNMLSAFMECLRLLLQTDSEWKYAITLQNHDIPLRTGFELVNALKALNGSNDVSVLQAIPDRIPKYANWTYKALHLFKDESKNDLRTLEITKGSSTCSLSRAFVDFIVNDLNLKTFIRLFNRMHYGVDEMLFATLQSSDELDAPGGYTTKCLETFGGYITRCVYLHPISVHNFRRVIWQNPNQKQQDQPMPCKSGMERHRVCILGVADLADLDSSRFLFANKMMPEMDYSAISCWAQRLLNRSRTQERDESLFDSHYYSHLAVVRFNRNRQFYRRNIETFRC